MKVKELLSCQAPWAYGGGYKIFKILSFAQRIIFHHCIHHYTFP